MKEPTRNANTKTSTSRRRFLQGVGGAAGVAAIYGTPFRPARAANELTMLTWNGFAEPEVVGEFERRHNVTIRAKYYTGGDQMLALIAQSPPGTYDVVLADGEYVQQLRAAGYVEKLNPADYPFDDYFPEFRRFPLHWDGDDMYSVLLRYGFLGVSYNTEHVSAEEASTYRMFWDDRLKGKIAHFDWHLPNLGQISQLNGNPKPFDLSEDAWREVQETTMGLRSRMAGFFGYGGTLSALKTGEVHAMLGIGDWITGLLARDGGPFHTVVPEEGGLQWNESLCIGKDASNPELAKKFLQYMMSPEGQAKAATMKAYPAMIPSKAGWQRLAEVNPDAAKRQNMLLDEHNAMDIIRDGRISYRQLPVQQTLQDWNGFWQQYKNA